MSAVGMIAVLAANGVELAAEGDSLRVRGRIAEADMARLRRHKCEIVALLHLAEREGLSPELVHRLSADDLAACEGLAHNTLAAYLHALDRGERMDAGQVPPGFTAARYCQGCGPVWLWAGSPDQVVACPWCLRRKAGKALPRPADCPENRGIDK
jgi:hypothetical protein